MMPQFGALLIDDSRGVIYDGNILQNSVLYYKCFTIVIYDRNDIALYYKTRDDRN